MPEMTLNIDRAVPTCPDHRGLVPTSLGHRLGPTETAVNRGQCRCLYFLHTDRACSHRPQFRAKDRASAHKP